MASPYGGPCDVPLEPDTDTAWRFLCWWFGKCTDGVIELGWQVAATGNLTAFRRFPLEDEHIIEAIHAINSVPGQNLYFRASTISPDSPIGRTTDSFVKQSPGAWIDLDTPEHVAHARDVDIDPGTRVHPCGWVCTGRVPAPRYQLYVRTSEPIVSAPLIRQINLQFLTAYGGDRAVVNPTRLMRMPGTIAWPYKAGRQPELTSFGEYTDRATAYPLSTITGLLPPVESQYTNGHDHGENVETLASVGSITRESQLIAELLAGRGRWHNAMVELVAIWVHQRLSTPAIMLAARAFTQPGYTQQQTADEVRKAISGARQKWHIPEPTEPPTPDSFPTEFPASPFSWDAMLAVPPREWVYGHFLIRRFVSVLGAPGGTGKTAYAFVVALAIVSGLNLINEMVHEPGKVWIYNLEDPLEELYRRLHAAVLYHKLSRETIEDKLFLDSGRDRQLVTATVTRTGEVIVSPISDLIIAEIQRREIRVMIVDPFVRSHRLEENANDQIDIAAALWGAVADKANCAILLVHHFRKGGVSGDADAFRGASALVDAARAALSLSGMSEDEAKQFGISQDERWQYVRVDNAKLNLAPPPDRTMWLRLVGQDIDNETVFKPADNVQTIERWVPTPPTQDMTWPMIIRILEKIDAGPVIGEFYTGAIQAKERWAGVVLVEEGKSDAQAKAILREWQRSGLLEEGQYLSFKARRRIGCLRLNHERLQEMRQGSGDPDYAE
jgi:RecA-family ATPase